MREGWVQTALSDICKIQQGQTLAVSAMDGGDFPVFGANGIIGNHSAFNYRHKVVALGCRGSCGTVHLVNQSAWLANNVMAIWPKDLSSATTDFIALLIETADLKSTGVISGQVQPQITRASLAPLSVLIPPLAEQRRIVDVIESVDNYITALETQAETARTARSALLHDLLSNPGPDWVETTLSDVVEVLDRFRRPISSSEREKRLGEVPYYGATGQTGWIDESIFDEELVLLGEDAIDFLNPKARKAYRVSGPAWVNNHAHVLRPRPGVVLPSFLNESLNLVDYSRYTSYGTRSKLTQASMNQITLKIPSIEVQAKVEHLTLDIDQTIELQLQSLMAAANLRAALLSDLLSGNHEIPASYDQLLGAA